MKRLFTALLILALTLFFSASGEYRTADAAEKLCRGAEQLRVLCERYDEGSEMVRERIERLRSEWDERASERTMYMNVQNLQPVTRALRDIKDAAADGDAVRLVEAIRRLGYAADDLGKSERFSIENVL